MNEKISVLVVCAEAIIYLLLYNFHDRTFKPFHWEGSIITEKTKTVIMVRHALWITCWSF